MFFLHRSTHECEVSVSEGLLDKVNCNEDHLFKPFSDGNNGASTSVSQFLTRKDVQVKSLVSPTVTLKTNLKFLHNHERADGNADEEHVGSLLDSYSGAEEDKIPTLFNNLVYSLRNLKHSQLITAYQKIQDEKTKYFFLDALPILKTNAGVSLMSDFIKSGVLPAKITDGWFTSLAFYKNPTRIMISTLAMHLQDPGQSSILGITSLVSTFCANTDACIKIPEVHDVIRKLEYMLGDCSSSILAEDERLVLILKGLRNIGQTTDKGQSLKKCYGTKSNTIWVRLAALEAIRKMPCPIVQNDFGLLRVFKDRQEDSEVRIATYLAHFECLTDVSAEKIKELLSNEPINQVGSFIWTHLTNIQESKSKDRWKIYLKNTIGSEALQSKWNTDPRKFSRNLEFSHFTNEFRVGGTIDSNIIFSEKSYIPRSAMLNLTANIFGEDINFLEFGARVEGFEDTVEQIFGPDGYFREDSVLKFIKSLRPKRDVSNAEAFHELFGAEVKVVEPRGNMYMRLFGKDLYYNSFQGLSNLMSNTVMKPMDFIGFNLGENKMNFSKSSMFLDGSIIVPTIVGMPMNLTVNGTNTVNLQTETFLDVKDIFRTGSALLNAKVYPTVTLEVSALMALDAFVSKTGLKSVTKLHSSAYADVFAEVNGGRLLKFHVNLPTERSEVIDASAEFFTYDTGRAIMMEGIKYMKFKLSPSMSATCANYSSISLYFHISRPIG